VLASSITRSSAGTSVLRITASRQRRSSAGALCTGITMEIGPAAPARSICSGGISIAPRGPGSAWLAADSPL
jgi:hypothetical protein